MLTKLTNLMEALLFLGKKEWLLAIPEMHWLTCIIIPTITIFTFKLKTIPRIIILSILLIITLIVLPLITTIPNTTYIPETYNKLQLIKINNKITLIDNGAFRYKINPEQYVIFTLKPYIIKKHGLLNFNLILNKPCLRSLKAANTLCNAFNIEKLYIKPHRLSKQAYLYLQNPQNFANRKPSVLC